MLFPRSEVGAVDKLTVDPSLSMMDRGFGVTSTSLAIEIKGLEPGSFPLSSPVSQKGEEEEDGSPLKEIRGREDIPFLLRASTGGEAPSQMSTLPYGATLPTGSTYISINKYIANEDKLYVVFVGKRLGVYTTWLE